MPPDTVGEIARYAASLVRIEYEEQAFVTDLHQQRDQAFVVEKPEKPLGDSEKAFAAASVRHEAEYFIPTEHHNPMELFASTVAWDGGGKLTAEWRALLQPVMDAATRPYGYARATFPHGSVLVLSAAADPLPQSRSVREGILEVVRVGLTPVPRE